MNNESQPTPSAAQKAAQETADFIAGTIMTYQWPIGTGFEEKRAAIESCARRHIDVMLASHCPDQSAELQAARQRLEVTKEMVLQSCAQNDHLKQDLRTSQEHEADSHKFFLAVMEAVGMKGEVGSLNSLQIKIVERVAHLQKLSAEFAWGEGETATQEIAQLKAEVEKFADRLADAMVKFGLKRPVELIAEAKELSK